MEQTFDETAKAYQEAPAHGDNFDDFVTRYAQDPKQYKQDAMRLPEMLKRGAELAAMGTRWREEPTIRGGNIPKPDTNLRISPKP